MAKGQVGMHLVVVSPTVPALCQVARLLEVLDDLRRTSFGDADARGDVPEPDVWVAVDAGEDVGVIGDEAPVVVIDGT